MKAKVLVWWSKKEGSIEFICSDCGVPTLSNERYCESCGTKLIPPKSINVIYGGKK